MPCHRYTGSKRLEIARRHRMVTRHILYRPEEVPTPHPRSYGYATIHKTIETPRDNVLRHFTRWRPASQIFFVLVTPATRVSASSMPESPTARVASAFSTAAPRRAVARSQPPERQPRHGARAALSSPYGAPFMSRLYTRFARQRATLARYAAMMYVYAKTPRLKRPRRAAARRAASSMSTAYVSGSRSAPT